MNNITNLQVIKIRPDNARSRLEAITSNGHRTIAYNNSIHDLLRIAMALKATSITITTLH